MPALRPRDRSTPVRSGVLLFSGASYPFRAFALFWRSPRLLKYVVMPVALNVALGVVFYWSLLRWLGQNLDEAVAFLPDWLSFLAVILQVLLVLVLFVVTGFIFLQFGVLLGSPWYGRLSEELERLRLGQVHQPEVGHPLFASLVDLWRAIAYELKKLLLWAMIMVPILAFHFIPGVGTAIATIGSIMLAALMTCMDFLDPSLERRRLQFRRKLQVVMRHLPATATFGIVCLGLISIPFFNLFAIPICVAAGTLLFCDRVMLTPQLLSPGQLPTSDAPTDAGQSDTAPENDLPISPESANAPESPQNFHDRD
ncbi:MAG: EI24 domain-containing protein [Elainellaceae cyanobacterium]